MRRSRRFRLDHPLDVRATLGVLGRGRRDLTTRVAADGIWRATWTPDGPVTVHVDDRRSDPHHAGGEVGVHAWGPGVAWALHHAPGLLGLHDDVTAFHPRDAVVADAHRRQRGLRLCRTLTLTEALVPVILEQKVQSVAARRSWAGLVRVHGEPAPGPVPLRLPPEPARLAGLGYEAFHRFNVERRRADTIRRVCARSRSIDRLGERTPAEAQRLLEAVPGIGPWTAATACLHALGSADAVVVGDYHLPNIVAYTLAGEHRATDERMLELLAPYAGQRARVQRLLTSAGRRPERRGPKLAIRSIVDA